MANLKHHKAIKLIEKRIQELQTELEAVEKKMEEPEMVADYEFAFSDSVNFNQEITELQKTIKYLMSTD